MPKFTNPKILFAGSEAAPYAKVGGLGDVLGALPKALAKKGVEIALIIPKYEIVGRNYKTKQIIKNFTPSFCCQKKISVYSLEVDDVQIFFLENKEYLSQGPIYFEQTAFVGSFKEIQRFVFFSAAVFELLKSNSLPLKPNIVHANDWHTGALVSLIKNSKLPLKTIFTIHNLENQGRWNFKTTARWFQNALVEVCPFQQLKKDANFMAEGIRNTDVLTTVSPTYAQEIKTEQYGAGLQNLISGQKNKIIGILNGIDYSVFNPANDSFLFREYSPNDNEGKEENKTALQKNCGLAIDKNKPLFGLVSRLTNQKGIDLIIPLIEHFAEQKDAQFAFLGMGEARFEKALIDAAKKHPENVFAKIGFSEELAHQIYAASDFFLMPSIVEPCGLGQMIAMRYGATPICRKTGGLEDSIKNNETGLLFNEPTPNALKEAMLKALRLFSDKKRLQKFRKQCFSENFSWENQTSKYIKLYKQIL